MELTCLTLAETASWQAALAEFHADADIYFSPEYHAPWEAAGKGVAECIVLRDGAAKMLLPYLRCAIPNADRKFDVQSAYGYGGPLVQNANETFLQEAWKKIAGYWREQRVVAAFLRLHPLVENHRWMASDWNVRNDRTTISIDVQNGLESAFGDSKNHRRTVLKALRLGYRAHREPITLATLELFIRNYYKSMERLSAGEAYFFSEKYFDSLVCSMKRRLTLHSVRCHDGESPAAMMMFCWGGKWGHAHLSWRRAGEDNCTTNLIFQSGAEEAVELGLKALHLGGGRTPHATDSLLEFKMRVGNRRHTFCTARLVVDERAYHDLNAAWCLRNNGSNPLWFLTYRQPPENPGVDGRLEKSY